MDKSYRKCRTCRFCRHADGMWVCVPEEKPTEMDGTCGRYRPGCCENCKQYVSGVCERTGQEMFELDVCSDFDPAGSFSQPGDAVGEDVLDAGLSLRVP